MSAIKRLIEAIYDDYIFERLTIEQLAKKYRVDKTFIKDAINMMSEALKGWED